MSVMTSVAWSSTVSGNFASASSSWLDRGPGSGRTARRSRGPGVPCPTRSRSLWRSAD
jgi:hypothetical protein